MTCPVCKETLSHYQSYEVVNGKRVHVDCAETVEQEVKKDENM